MMTPEQIHERGQLLAQIGDDIETAWQRVGNAVQCLDRLADPNLSTLIRSKLVYGQLELHQGLAMLADQLHDSDTEE